MQHILPVNLTSSQPSRRMASSRVFPSGTSCPLWYLSAPSASTTRRSFMRAASAR